MKEVVLIRTPLCNVLLFRWSTPDPAVDQVTSNNKVEPSNPHLATAQRDARVTLHQALWVLKDKFVTKAIVAFVDESM